MARWLKRWRRYKHSFKGDKWSKMNPEEFAQANGTGWIVIETVKLSDFKK